MFEFETIRNANDLAEIIVQYEEVYKPKQKEIDGNRFR